MRNSFEQTGIFCYKCGKLNPRSFNFCPKCGTACNANSQTQTSVNQHNASVVPPQEDETTAYLRKIGLLHLADKQYLIKFMLENGNIVTVPLYGKERSNDVLQYLRSTDILSKNSYYYFPNWPTAQSCIGPWYHHESACVCELDPDICYSIESIDITRIRYLYGCPNPKHLIESSVLDRVNVEVIEYEEK